MILIARKRILATDGIVPLGDIRSCLYYYAHANRQIRGVANESNAYRKSACFYIFNSTSWYVRPITVGMAHPMRTHFRLGKRSRYPWVFFALAALANTCIYFFAHDAKAFELYLASTGGIAGFVHFLYSQHNQGTQLFVTLFKEFNARYDSLNERLNAIFDRNTSELSSEDRKVLFDYFNLCAEEYLFFKAGYIDQDVWRSWLAGMRYFSRNANIRYCWETELKSGSYYGFTIELFD